MATPHALGIAKEIVTTFMNLLGKNSQHAADFFSSTAVLDWNSNIWTGKLDIFEALKGLPLFNNQLVEFDCQTFTPIPSMSMITMDGFLIIDGKAERYHATIIATMTPNEKAAHINYMALAFV